MCKQAASLIWKVYHLLHGSGAVTALVNSTVEYSENTELLWTLTQQLFSQSALSWKSLFQKPAAMLWDGQATWRRHRQAFFYLEASVLTLHHSHTLQPLVNSTDPSNRKLRCISSDIFIWTPQLKSAINTVFKYCMFTSKSLLKFALPFPSRIIYNVFNREFPDITHNSNIVCNRTWVLIFIFWYNPQSWIVGWTEWLTTTKRNMAKD